MVLQLWKIRPQRRVETSVFFMYFNWSYVYFLADFDEILYENSYQQENCLYKKLSRSDHIFGSIFGCLYWSYNYFLTDLDEIAYMSVDLKPLINEFINRSSKCSTIREGGLLSRPIARYLTKIFKALVLKSKAFV